MQDSDLLCFTSNNLSGVILKKSTDIELKDFLDKLIGIQYKLEFDNELIERILSIYDNIDFYKNKLN